VPKKAVVASMDIKATLNCRTSLIIQRFCPTYYFNQFVGNR
jgi:hypothetical protein